MTLPKLKELELKDCTRTHEENLKRDGLNKAKMDVGDIFYPKDQPDSSRCIVLYYVGMVKTDFGTEQNFAYKDEHSIIGSHKMFNEMLCVDQFKKLRDKPT